MHAHIIMGFSENKAYHYGLYVRNTSIYKIRKFGRPIISLSRTCLFDMVDFNISHY